MFEGQRGVFGVTVEGSVWIPRKIKTMTLPSQKGKHSPLVEGYRARYKQLQTAKNS